jgi:pimeloyl-ACP methyl ester carboxylesterase
MAVLASGIDEAELVIFEQSAHLAFVEEREQYLSVIAGFLARAEESVR